MSASAPWRAAAGALGGAALRLVAAAGLCAGCSDDPLREEPAWDLRCPARGSTCANASGPLLAGAALRDITPTVTETLLDCGMDQLCPGDAAYPGPDEGEGNAELDGHPLVPDPPAGLGERWLDADGDGVLDAVWIAGFGNARVAGGIHDPIWARALVLRQGETTLALVAMDLVGYFYDELVRLRAELPPELGIDHLLVAATHTHEGPDTVGIWGFDVGTTGVDPAYLARIRAETIAALREAVGSLAPAVVMAGAGPAGVHPDPAVTAARGVNNILLDRRDPVVLDAEMRVLSFTRADDGRPIATLVNWQNHPEALCDRNRYLSSDFVHYLRQGVEQGIHRGGVDVPGAGGVAVYVSGDLGGMMTPLGADVVDLDGTLYPSQCLTTLSPTDPFFDRARAIGELAALDALRLLREQGSVVEAPLLSFAAKRFRLEIQNWGYHAMFLTGVFYGRELYDFDRGAQLAMGNLPWVETEVSVVNVGPVQAITVPGELLPEYFLGGYDGSHTGPLQGILDEWFNQEPASTRACADASACPGAELAEGHVCGADNCLCIGGHCRSDDYNPPPLALAPGPPYLRDRMTGSIKMVWGLCGDELGYVIPPYDFALDPYLPYVEEAPGSHYEETNSIGQNVGPEVEKRLVRLLEALMQ